MAKSKSGGGSRGFPAVPKTNAARERVWAAQDALNTMRRSEEIKRDPKLLADARALANREMQALAKVAKTK